MRALIVNPPYMRLIDSISYGYNLPLGIVYVATEAARRGFYVRAYDSEFEPNSDQKHLSSSDIFLSHGYLHNALENETHKVWREIEARIRSFAPDVVGIQAMSCKYPMALKVATIAKKTNPAIKVVMGGHHPTIFPDEVIAETNVDFVARGEGEYTFAELLEALSGKRDVESVTGVSHKKEGKAVHNPDRAYEQELDRLGYPDRTLVLDSEEWPPDKFNFLMGSRGCPFPCKFCGTSNMWPKKTRSRSVGNVIEEMKMLRDRYGSRQFIFADDSFTLNRNRTIDFCKAVIREFDQPVTWICTTRFDLLDAELLAWMKRSGCSNVAVGVEAGNDRILRLLQKETDKKTMREKRQLIREAGIVFTSFFMTGLPTETRETMYDTLEFMKELEPDHAHFTIFSPQPKTGLYEMLKEEGKLDAANPLSYSQENISNFYAQGMTRDEYKRIVLDIAGKFHDYFAAKSLSGVGNVMRMYRMASLKQDAGALEEALEGFTSVINDGSPEAGPHLAGAHFHRGQIYLALGDKNGAKAELRKCLEIIPQHVKAKSLLKSLG